jgi:hypothetical protein
MNDHQHAAIEQARIAWHDHQVVEKPPCQCGDLGDEEEHSRNDRDLSR